MVLKDENEFGKLPRLIRSVKHPCFIDPKWL